MRLKGIKKLKRMKFLSTILIFFLVITLNVVFICANERETTLKEDLMILGIIKDGTGVYDTNIVNKQEMVTVLVRMLGKEEYALNEDVSIPFTDVAKWNEKYVNYVYNEDILKGTSETTFGGKEYFGINHAVTFMLRTLGYEDEKDFEWNKAYDYALEIGLLSEEDNLDKEIFTRSDMFTLIEKTLKFKVKDTNSSSSKDEKKSLIRKLVDDMAYTEEKCNETLRFRFEEKKDNIVTEVIKKIKRSSGGSSEPAKVLTDIKLEQKRKIYYGYIPDKDDIKVSAIYDGDYTKPKELTSDTNVTYELDPDNKTVKVTYTEGDVTKDDTIDVDIEWYSYMNMINFLVLDRDEANEKMLIMMDPAMHMVSYSNAETADAVSWKDSFLRYAMSSENELGIMLGAIDTELDNGITTDNVFILSAEELNRYLPIGGVYEDYRIAKNSPMPAATTCYYWLRTKDATSTPPIVKEDGTIGSAPSNAATYNDKEINVRMTLWVEDKDIEYSISISSRKYFTKDYTLDLDRDFIISYPLTAGYYMPLQSILGEYGDSLSELVSAGVLETNIETLQTEMGTTGTKTFTAKAYFGEMYVEGECTFEVIDVGSEIEFGNYYQTSNTVKEPIKWTVTNINDIDHIRIVANNILEQHIVDENEEELVYPNAELFTWYYNSFVDDAFSIGERIRLYETGIFDTDDFNNTNVNKNAKATTYAKNKGVTVDANGNGYYWIDSGWEADDSYYVDSNGSKTRASSNTLTNVGVRPYAILQNTAGVDDYRILGLSILVNPYYLQGVPLTEDDICVAICAAINNHPCYFETQNYTSNLSSINYNEKGTITIEVSKEIEGKTYTMSADSKIIGEGDIIPFGRYPEYDPEEDVVYWRVSYVDETNNKAFLITENVINNIKYHYSSVTSGESLSYGSTNLRNQCSIYFRFDSDEDDSIGLVNISGWDEKMPFALNNTELETYVPQAYRKAKPLERLESAMASVTDTDGYVPYWLRKDTVTDDNLTDYVDCDGTAKTGKNITDEIGYRAGLWFVPSRNLTFQLAS